MLCMSIICAVVCLMWFTIRNFSGLPTIYEPMLWSLITKKKKNSKLKSFISNSPFQKGSKKGNNMASSSEEISYSLVRSNHYNLVQLKLLKKNGKSKYNVHLFFSQWDSSNQKSHPICKTLCKKMKKKISELPTFFTSSLTITYFSHVHRAQCINPLHTS